MKSAHRLAIVLVLIVGVAAGCPIYTAKHPVELNPAQAIPVLPQTAQAPKDAIPVAITRPRDLRPDQEVHQLQVLPIFPLPVSITHSFVAEGDAGVWVANALSAGLENAGFDIQHVEKATEAKTPVVVSVDVTSLKAENAVYWTSVGCKGLISAQVQVTKSGQSVLDRTYSGEHEENGPCHQNASEALKQALEKLLETAVPEIAASLSKITQPSAVQAASPR